MGSIFDRTNDPYRKLYELEQQYRNVRLVDVNNQIFIIRSLGRQEYRNIIEDDSINNVDREDIICRRCILHPKKYDFDNCEAGLPTNLTKEILEFSFLDSFESRDYLTAYYRYETMQLENQITCLIHEAFPQFDIEEIEKWDVERTTKYMANAEWILENLRGRAMTKFSFVDIARQQGIGEETTPAPKDEIKTEEIMLEKDKKPEPKKEKVDANALEEMKRQFPQMDWDNLITPEQAFKNNDAFLGMDTRPPALRDKSVKLK